MQDHLDSQLLGDEDLSVVHRSLAYFDSGQQPVLSDRFEEVFAQESSPVLALASHLEDLEGGLALAVGDERAVRIDEEEHELVEAHALHVEAEVDVAGNQLLSAVVPLDVALRVELVNLLIVLVLVVLVEGTGVDADVEKGSNGKLDLDFLPEGGHHLTRRHGIAHRSLGQDEDLVNHSFDPLDCLFGAAIEVAAAVVRQVVI